MCRLSLARHVRATALALTALLGGVSTAGAVDFGLIARVFGGTLESGVQKSDQLGQRYNLNFSQALTPWLSLRLSYLYNSFETRPQQGSDFYRRSAEPLLELTYARPNLSGRIELRERRNRSTTAAQNFDVDSLLGAVEWRPRKGPRISARYQDQTNVADLTVFGRDVSSELWQLDVIYDRPTWSARYSHQDLDLENRLTGFLLDQGRHDLRLDFGERLVDNRLLVSLSGLISRVDQTQRSPSSATVLRLVSAAAGLFALDTSPEVGELGNAPQLIDGDLTSRTQPPVDIGGANTFRNVGVDLGVTRPASRLEITVDSPSDPALVWLIFESPDNLTWRQIVGVQSAFDISRLQYTLAFPETVSRYFKAVNISANVFEVVAVTEVRALVETDALGRRDDKSTVYRANLFTDFQVTPRFALGLSASVRNEEAVAGGLASQELEELSYNAEARIELREQLSLRLTYRFSDLEEKLEPVLRRQQDSVAAELEWTPLPTATVKLLASSRGEREESTLIRSVDSMRLRAFTELLPDLTLTSEVAYNRVDDPFFGFTQTSWEWRESLDSRPTPRWTLGGSLAYISYDSTGAFRLNRRTRLDLRTTWRATPYVALSADWSYADDDFQESLSQRYSFSWRPGRRLNANLSYQDLETLDLRRTSNAAATLSYRVNRRLTAWGAVTRSLTDLMISESTRSTTARIGFNLFI